MRSFIVGTAGHIDHGKTSLVRALTGVDTDRLAEEKRRGITIELGFAHLDLGRDDGLDPPARIGIVDVPGHERFIKAMVAGAGGIDLVMLVIAADEGVMPQTREHLDICRLLGVQRGIVALTKSDLVDDDFRELAIEDVRETLREAGALAEAPIIPCSAQTGDGIDVLRKTLAEHIAALDDRAIDGPLRLPLDRVFSLKGFGTVVTGSLISGTIKAGDAIEVLPVNERATVRTVQVHGESVAQAVAGQRTALNLGGVDRDAIARGEVVAHVGRLRCSSMLDVRVELLGSTRSALKARSKVLFHLGTRQQMCSLVLLSQREPLEAGKSALAQLRFDVPVVALPGDRFVLRGFAKQQNHGTTIGGGEVLRVLSSKLRARDRDAVARLAALEHAAPAERLLAEVYEAGEAGMERADLEPRLRFGATQIAELLRELVADGRLLRFDEPSFAVVHGEHAAALRAEMLELVDTHHRQQPLKLGISRAELHSRLPDGVAPKLFSRLLDELNQRGELASEQDVCLRPAHRERVHGALGPVADQIAALYRSAGLAPPWDSELSDRIDADDQRIDGARKLLLSRGTLVRVQTLLFHREVLDELESRLRSYLQAHGEITAADFKTMVGQSRKYVIPLAEHFDAALVTVRDGDVRRLR
ncbi:MAG: selenocysteine-specific translation elongation factor [Myxococcales bacterium]|nr:selenocysteine-specific translation elongation factor [Myxococcales bacterium]